MPFVTSDYDPPWPFRNGHVQTIYAGLFRRVDAVHYERERIDTPDGDFLDLDWARIGSDRLAILSHGLEGSTQSGYMLGMTRALQRRGWDVLAWNYRGCSGEVNRLPRSYHSGATDDLGTLISTAVPEYRHAALIGFSLGGNLTLKYLGENGSDLDGRIRSAVAISAPCDLAAGADHMARPSNAAYMQRFMGSLRQKVLEKAAAHPGVIDTAGIERMRSFHEFDERYTAPLHGFADAEDYWRRCSSIHFISDIAVPTLIVNAIDDPLLPESCYPVELARDHPYVHLCTPHFGGHLGFVAQDRGSEYWSERRAAEFLEAADSLDSPDVLEAAPQPVGINRPHQARL